MDGAGKGSMLLEELVGLGTFEGLGTIDGLGVSAGLGAGAVEDLGVKRCNISSLESGVAGAIKRPLEAVGEGFGSGFRFLGGLLDAAEGAGEGFGLADGLTGGLTDGLDVGLGVVEFGVGVSGLLIAAVGRSFTSKVTIW
jgi:hypothetical protein